MNRYYPNMFLREMADMCIEIKFNIDSNTTIEILSYIFDEFNSYRGLYIIYFNEPYVGAYSNILDVEVNSVVQYNSMISET